MAVVNRDGAGQRDGRCTHQGSGDCSTLGLEQQVDIAAGCGGADRDGAHRYRRSIGSGRCVKDDVGSRATGVGGIGDRASLRDLVVRSEREVGAAGQGYCSDRDTGRCTCSGVIACHRNGGTCARYCERTCSGHYSGRGAAAGDGDAIAGADGACLVDRLARGAGSGDGHTASICCQRTCAADGIGRGGLRDQADIAGARRDGSRAAGAVADLRCRYGADEHIAGGGRDGRRGVDRVAAVGCSLDHHTRATSQGIVDRDDLRIFGQAQIAGGDKATGWRATCACSAPVRVVNGDGAWHVDSAGIERRAT